MLSTESLIDISRFLVGVIILAYASYTDIKTRKASNYLWVIMGIAGAILLILQIILFESGELDSKMMYLLFVPFMIFFVYVLFQLRLIFGGADAKALMALAILVPFMPEIQQFPLMKDSLMPFSWTVFSNSIILFLLIPLSLLFTNIIRRNIQFPHCLLGYKMDIKKAKEKFVWPLERIVDGKRKFVYMPKEFDVEEELAEFEKNNYTEIWVTPKVPFMIPLLAGFIVAFIFGDLLVSLMGSIL